METVFWISVLALAYIYAGYPLLVRALAFTLRRRVRASSEHLPSITVLTAAFNEAEHIASTIRNKLDQEYPAELLEVIVVSDASTDGTDEIVRAFDERVHLIRQEPRAGKTAALARAVEHARGEILVFADANSIYAGDAIRRLAENFADPDVGYVTGKMVYTNPDGSLVGDGCSAYMKYENYLREAETRMGSVVGVDGGIDAVRRGLFTPMQDDQQPDLVLPLCVAAAGYRVVYEPRALLQEPVLSKYGAEYRMRVRVSLRALWALWDKRALLNPLRYPQLAFQIVSHKILRYIAFVPLVLLFVSALSLIGQGVLFTLAAATQIAAYALASIGWYTAGERGGAVFGFPFYFALLNIACAHATWKFLAGHKQATWAPRTG